MRNTYFYSFEEKLDPDATAYTVEAYDAHSAAEEACENEDISSAEYPDERDVWITLDASESIPKKFRVSAENTRSYRACEIVPTKGEKNEEESKEV